MSMTGLKEGLRTGNVGLDYEHRKLVEAMEVLCGSFSHAETSGETSDLFGVLYATASAHFALEESIMREKKYASYDAHKADHERLLEQIRHMMDAYERGMCKDCAINLRECLVGWFSSHATNADAELRTLAD